MIIKPKTTTLSKALTPDLPKPQIQASAQTVKESEFHESYTILSANNEKSEDVKNKPAKLGRWTLEEKQKFIDGKLLFHFSYSKKDQIQKNRIL